MVLFLVKHKTNKIFRLCFLMAQTHFLEQYLQKTLHDNGKDVLAVKVISLCHPRHSGKLLATDNERIVSSLMPCRISVYEKSDGKTYVSRLNSSLMAPLIGDLVAEVMSRSAADVEEIIRLALQ
jgi:uncharacterized protein (DUF302 family)